jgi:hypothetical protein
MLKSRKLKKRTCVHEIEFCDDGQRPSAFRVDLSRNFDRLGGRDVGVRG